MEILLIIYWILAYMALNKVWYSKRTYLVLDSAAFLLRKLVASLFLGWILIPIALIQIAIDKK